MKVSYFGLLVLILIFTNASGQELSNKEVDSLFKVVSSNIEKENFENAESILEILKKETPNDPDIHQLKLNFYKAEILIEQDNDEAALNILLPDIVNLKKYKSSSYHSKYAEMVGRIFARAAEYQEALEYLNLALESANYRKDSMNISSVNLNLGSIYQMQQQLDSAAYYYDKVMLYYPKLTTDYGTLATAYSNLIGVSLGRGDFDSAEQYASKSLEIHKERKDTLKIGGVLSNLGSINMYKRELDKANDYYFEAYEILLNSTELKAKEIRVLTLDNISQIFYLKEEYKTAYDYLFESVGFDKELLAESQNFKIIEIETKYNLAQKEAEAEIEKNKRQQAELLSYILVILILISLGILLLFRRANKLKRQKLNLELSQEKINQARELERLQNEAQVRILNATINGKESERRQIAEILHDNVSTLLSAANLHLYATRSELNTDIPEDFDKIEKIINEASDKIRDLSHKLMSSVLLKFGLASAGEELCEKYSNSKLVLSCDSINVKRYDESFEIRIYNIIEELLNNIIKHSEANLASIKMESFDNKLHIKVEDNGKGFNTDKIVHCDGLGLNQIKARIKMMEGSINIKSPKKSGTSIIMEIPISD